jgi:peptidoglycan biosynthesis protein MviN/MurJ (putative lipid II flippase)
VPAAGWVSFVSRIVIATAAMGITVYWLRLEIGDWLALAVWSRVAALAGVVAAGLAAYFAACLLIGLRPSSLGARGHQESASL